MAGAASPPPLVEPAGGDDELFVDAEECADEGSAVSAVTAVRRASVCSPILIAPCLAPPPAVPHSDALGDARLATPVALAPVEPAAAADVGGRQTRARRSRGADGRLSYAGMDEGSEPDSVASSHASARSPLQRAVDSRTADLFEAGVSSRLAPWLAAEGVTVEVLTSAEFSMDAMVVLMDVAMAVEGGVSDLERLALTRAAQGPRARAAASQAAAAEHRQQRAIEKALQHADGEAELRRRRELADAEHAAESAARDARLREHAPAEQRAREEEAGQMLAAARAEQTARAVAKREAAERAAAAAVRARERKASEEAAAAEAAARADLEAARLQAQYRRAAAPAPASVDVPTTCQR